MTGCRDCGIEYERVGGDRSCGACLALRARGECLGCGMAIERNGHRGPLPRRCAGCKAKHKQRQAYGYVRARMERDPQFAAAERERRRLQTAARRAADPEGRRKADREAKARAYADPDRRARVQTQARLGRIARKYGLSAIEYQLLLDRFGGACAICRAGGEGVVLCVDHDHATGKVRGILCQACNIGLGGFADDAAKLRGALKYLSRYGS